MNIGVVSVAFYTHRFSPVFINSFRHFYSDVTLIVVDNNMDGELGRLETSMLRKRKDIIYMKNDGSGHHGLGLDEGKKRLHLMGKEVMVVVDIDSVFKKRDILKKCWGYYKQGYKMGGRKALRGDGRLHPSFAFYDLGYLMELGISFDYVMGYDCAEAIFNTVKEDEHAFIYFDFIEHLDHFGCGSLLRDDGRWGHKKYREGERVDFFRRRHLEKRRVWFNREDVKRYL